MYWRKSPIHDGRSQYIRLGAQLAQGGATWNLSTAVQRPTKLLTKPLSQTTIQWLSLKYLHIQWLQVLVESFAHNSNNNTHCVIANTEMVAEAHEWFTCNITVTTCVIK